MKVHCKIGDNNEIYNKVDSVDEFVVYEWSDSPKSECDDVDDCIEYYYKIHYY